MKHGEGTPQSVLIRMYLTDGEVGDAVIDPHASCTGFSICYSLAISLVLLCRLT